MDSKEKYPVLIQAPRPEDDKPVSPPPPELPEIAPSDDQ